MRRKQSNSHLDNRQVVMLENAFYQVRADVMAAMTRQALLRS